jgi:hypothetical protein
MFHELPEKANSLVLSYIGIRRAIGMSGFLLPVVLGPIGSLVFGVDIQDNLSSYYHTELRDVFVGTMCAMGIFLLCYRGYNWVENWTANAGCLSAIGVALFPLDQNSDPLFQKTITGYIHTASGGMFFLTLAFYSMVHFPRTRDTKRETETHPAERKFIYRMTGIVILISMAAMGCYLLLLPAEWKQLLNRYNFLFWMESIAVWSFASAWLTAGRTILAEIAVELLAIPHDLLSKR